VGALAAGAAHELATPLTTMAVVAGEIVLQAGTPELKRDAEVLAGQIGICRETIGNMMAAAGHAGAVGGGRERLERFLESIAARCRATRPEANIVCAWDAGLSTSEIFAEQSLRQALLAVLNNAVDASPEDVRFTGMRHEGELRLSIADRGQGLPEGEIDKLGRRVFTTKPRGQGAGLGLVLAVRAVERLGGTLGWKKRPDGGTCAEIVLPWNALSLEERA
jgi:two-component system sensor histidine kinase RegB